MVHTAYQPSLLLNTTSKIEAIDVAGNSLFIATERNELLHYHIEEYRPSATDSVPSLRVKLKDQKTGIFSRPATQMTIVAARRMLIVLTNGVVQIHELPSCQMLQQLSSTRGCHLFSVDSSMGDFVYVACAIKKRILVIRIDASGSLSDVSDITTAEVVRAMAWCGRSLCVGLKKEYVMIDAFDKRTTELCPINKGVNPMVISLPDDRILVGRDTVSFFFGADGKAAKRYGLAWSESPITVTLHYPYIVGILPRGVEVRTELSAHEVQSIPTLRGARFLCSTQSQQGMSLVYVALPQAIHCLVPVRFQDQVEELKRTRQFEDAILLCEAVQFYANDYEKMEALQTIRLQLAYHLFRTGSYKEAMDLMKELKCSPLQVIGLFSKMLPQVIEARLQREEVTELSGIPLVRAQEALIDYLVEIRDSVLQEAEQAEVKPDPLSDNYATCSNPAVIVDTSLLKAYIKAKESLAIYFIRGKNYCHVKECEKELLARGKLPELVQLYRSKGLHSLALELLQQNINKPSALRGPTHIIQYLSKLGVQHWNLILQYSEPLASVSDEILDIFTELRSPDQALPPHEVASFIYSNAPRLLVRYLEWLVGEQKEEAPEFHNDLALQYLDEVRRLQTAPGGEARVSEIRQKLVKFLKDSKHYQPAKVLGQLLNDFPQSLFEERAILFSRVGRHEQALRIYAVDLKRFDLAEAYCEQAYTEDPEGAKSVYLALLDVLVRPNGEREATGNPALILDFLKKNYLRLDPSEALLRLSDRTPIQDLISYFEAVIRGMMDTQRNNEVIKNLLKAEDLQVRKELVAATSRVITIDEDTMCPVCKRRMGLTAFAVYPNNKVVHYKCRKDDDHVCPVTGVRFDVPAQ